MQWEQSEAWAACRDLLRPGAQPSRPHELPRRSPPLPGGYQLQGIYAPLLRLKVCVAVLRGNLQNRHLP
jgi:hypothetical protein